MSIEQVLRTVRAFDGVRELAPAPGSEFPEVARGDHSSYHAPDGVMPTREQPYARIVTKDYPDDIPCRLDDAGR